ncbi:MAG: sugar phosphate isomerase/epimerase [Pseudomonadota bacterium]
MTDFSYQLYSSRNFPPLSDTLKMVAAAGYRQVEGYGGLYGSDEAIETLRAGLGETGLAMPTSHFSYELVRDEPRRAIEIAKALDVKAVLVPFIGDHDRDAAAWAQFGRDLAEAGKPIQDAGFQFGWHNHAFEFADLGGEDKPLDLILGGSEDVRLELDIAWAEVAGERALDWVAKYADRMIAVHLKDIAPAGTAEDEDGWADVGHGVLDWAAIIEATANTRAEYFVIEHDNPSDDKRFATRSIAAANAL